MKNIKVILSLACVCAFTACATTQNSQTANTQTTASKAAAAAQNMSFEDVMQKSQELREQVENAKNAYKTAQQVNNATSATDGVKNQVNKQIESAKQQIKNEADAWKELAK